LLCKSACGTGKKKKGQKMGRRKAGQKGGSPSHFRWGNNGGLYAAKKGRSMRCQEKRGGSNHDRQTNWGFYARRREKMGKGNTTKRGLKSKRGYGASRGEKHTCR